MNKLSSLRKLLNKESGIYSVNGFNVKWDLESKTWQPSDIITLLRILPQNVTVYNMLHHLDEELSIIDNWCDRFYSLTENKNLTSTKKSVDFSHRLQAYMKIFSKIRFSHNLFC